MNYYVKMEQGKFLEGCDRKLLAGLIQFEGKMEGMQAAYQLYKRYRERDLRDPDTWEELIRESGSLYSEMGGADLFMMLNRIAEILEKKTDRERSAMEQGR